MKQTTVSMFRRNISAMMNSVNDDHEALIVIPTWGKPVVMVPLDEYHEMKKPVKRTVATAGVTTFLQNMMEADEMTFAPEMLPKTKAANAK